ncbi:MAG: DUF3465 domain-containing protein [Verrucomicrobiota bacterium JB024]|nr:DUF3465 domain-containing protein [Verrucomicrobiota bacterium JB024]
MKMKRPRLSWFHRREGFSRGGLIVGAALAGLVGVLVMREIAPQAAAPAPVVEQPASHVPLPERSVVTQPVSERSLSAEEAFRQRLNKVWLSGEGVVIKVLPDDEKGSRHQRFILRLPSGQTLLIAHNIDVAPRIPGLKNEDTVRYYGEYIWNNKGGLVHWTHRKSASEPGGWLEKDGRRYE